MLAYRLIQTQIERTYLQIITSAEPDFEDELGLYYQALLDLRNGRPHLVMILESFGGDDPSPVQMEGLRAVSFAQLADMPVSMTPLLRDNLPQALAEILFSKMALGLAPRAHHADDAERKLSGGAAQIAANPGRHLRVHPMQRGD